MVKLQTVTLPVEDKWKSNADSIGIVYMKDGYVIPDGLIESIPRTKTEWKPNINDMVFINTNNTCTKIGVLIGIIRDIKFNTYYVEANDLKWVMSIQNLKPYKSLHSLVDWENI